MIIILLIRFIFKLCLICPQVPYQTDTLITFIYFLTLAIYVIRMISHLPFTINLVNSLLTQMLADFGYFQPVLSAPHLLLIMMDLFLSWVILNPFFGFPDS